MMTQEYYSKEEKINMINNIKSLIYKLYVNTPYTKDINEVCTELIGSIPSSSLIGINKDHNGIILSFSCTSYNVSKYDIEDITIKILRDYINQKANYNFSIMNFLSDDENVRTLFRVMFVKGLSFSIII